MENSSIIKQAKSDIFKELHPIINFYIKKGATPIALKKYYKNSKRLNDLQEDIKNKGINLVKDEEEYKKLVKEILNDLLDDFIAKQKDEEYKKKEKDMKHIKTFENFELNENVFITTLGILAILKILSDIIKRKRIIGGLRKKDFTQLEYFIKKSSKELVGKVIDNSQECQIIYEFGNSDNLITFHLDKVEKTFSFTWDFAMPLLPYLKYSDSDKLKNIELTDNEFEELYEVFTKIKSQQFTDSITY